MNDRINFLKIFLLLGLCTLTACKEKSTEVFPTGIPSFSFEMSQCISSALGKGVNTLPDSICTYSFSDYLILDFSAIGNCCPDSNRFVVNHQIKQDTILITVSDTARSMCYCMCLYMIHTEISNLPLDKYVIRCRLVNGESYLDPMHLITVMRKKS
jgi:hypothetical protein